MFRIFLAPFLAASIFFPVDEIPLLTSGMSEASICCPNDCYVESIQTPIGRQMIPVCKIYQDECKEIKGDIDEECFCQCVEDSLTYELKSECFCAKIIYDDIFSF